MNLLKKKKGDQDIQEIVSKYDTYGKKATKKQMHHAVNDLDRARNAMDVAIQARTNLMNNWQNFLTASLERWREYTGQFQQQEAKCQEEIAKAKEDLAKAKVEFQASPWRKSLRSTSLWSSLGRYQHRIKSFVAAKIDPKVS